ncbi:hypothetical protein I540_1076 [Mycobacteroides abscessus subsp. bolletii 1513]|uniref:Uncharacterized protein n=1 Tax=Mycobacteroides abscessus subsp. bolletii 1513 TaxID=1299321 RepID=X8DT57_9MYCO|nr:hypothetical protein I540_1076 [Mycobacteroides abscessus subsp. bolletii 1513]
MTSKNKDAVVAAFKTLTARARFLCDGGTPPDLGIGEPPPTVRYWARWSNRMD